MSHSSSRQAAGTELTAETLKRFGSVFLSVHGSSMLPSVRPGDEIELRSTPINSINTGEIIAFQRNGRLFVHRVIGNDPAGRLITRGDTLPQADAPVVSDEFLGVVAALFRDGERVDHQATAVQRLAATIFRRVPLCAALFVKFAW